MAAAEQGGARFRFWIRLELCQAEDRILSLHQKVGTTSIDVEEETHADKKVTMFKFGPICVQNLGSEFQGHEVVQIYMQRSDREYMELLHFVKIKNIQPGATSCVQQTVEIIGIIFFRLCQPRRDGTGI